MQDSSAARQFLKDYVRSNISASEIDALAMHMVGSPDEVRTAKLNATQKALFGLFLQNVPDMPEVRAFGLSFAVGEVLRERIAEIEANGSGQA